MRVAEVMHASASCLGIGARSAVRSVVREHLRRTREE